jgi:hypothetical protein
MLKHGFILVKACSARCNLGLSGLKGCELRTLKYVDSGVKCSGFCFGFVTLAFSIDWHHFQKCRDIFEGKQTQGRQGSPSFHDRTLGSMAIISQFTKIGKLSRERNLVFQSIEEVRSLKITLVRPRVNICSRQLLVLPVSDAFFTNTTCPCCT